MFSSCMMSTEHGNNGASVALSQRNPNVQALHIHQRTALLS